MTAQKYESFENLIVVHHSTFCFAVSLFDDSMLVLSLSLSFSLSLSAKGELFSVLAGPFLRMLAFMPNGASVINAKLPKLQVVQNQLS